MFVWLENTQLAIWVGESLYAYPVLLGAHVIGLAVVVGIFCMRDLRLLGCFTGLAPDSFLPISKFAWLGFVINAVSGALLFTSQASYFVENVPFLLKISSIALGLVVATIIQGRLRGELAGAGGDAQIGTATKVIAAVSIGIWVFAIVTGRLIAYAL